MAAGGSRRNGTAVSRETRESASGETEGEEHEEEGVADGTAGVGALHERLVAYVHALSGESNTRCGVWIEHSYARTQAGHAPFGSLESVFTPRVLLAPRTVRVPSDGRQSPLDVETLLPAPPAPPLSPSLPNEHDHEEMMVDEDNQWEEKVKSLAPSAAHARLAAAALEAVNALRLAVLALPAGAGPECRAACVRSCSRRLRCALAPLWAWSGGGGVGGGASSARPVPASWLHAALLAYLPPPHRALYEQLAEEVARAAPRLATRLRGAHYEHRVDPLAEVGPPVDADSGPWLVWVRGGGGGAADARWERRLSALVHTRAVPDAVAHAAPSAPDAWCASHAAAARAALLDILAEAGSRCVVVGGSGAGAALCTALAGGSGGVGGAGASGGAAVRGLALLAPPLLTPEGPRLSPDDPLFETQLPMLLVCGTGGGGARCWRGGACEVGVAGRGGRRRVVLVAGADDALRVPPARRRRLRLSQHALDAAIAEEVAKFVHETAETRPTSGEGVRSDHSDLPELTDTYGISVDVDAVLDDDEFVNIPPSTAPRVPYPTATTHSGTRAIEIVEGRVVSRTQGGIPLSLPLPAPRRAHPASAPAAAAAATPAEPIAAADILQMPIVFADDEPQAPRTESGEVAEPAAVSVRSGGAVVGSGGLKFTRVIVAKRAGAGVGAGRGVRGAARASPRPVVLRRALRVLPTER